MVELAKFYVLYINSFVSYTVLFTLISLFVILIQHNNKIRKCNWLKIPLFVQST